MSIKPILPFALAVLTISLLTGCRSGTTPKIEPLPTRDTPDIWWTGIVLRDGDYPPDEQLIDFTQDSVPGMPIMVNMPLTSNQDLRFHVSQVIGEEQYNYDVLAGRSVEPPSPPSPPAEPHEDVVKVEFQSSAVHAVVVYGWVFLVGTQPQSATGWGVGAASGKEVQFGVIVVRDGAGQAIENRFYNLEPIPRTSPPSSTTRDASKTVTVTGSWPGGRPVTLEPGEYVIFPEQHMETQPDTIPIPPDDQFVPFLRQRALAAKLPYHM